MQVDNKFFSEFQPKLVKYLNDNNYTIRLLAKRIFDMANIDVSILNAKPLSLAYEIELPAFKTLDSSLPGAFVKPGEPLPDTTDILHIVTITQSALKLLSYYSHIPYQNLVIKTKNLMYEFYPENLWNKDAELSLRRQMHSFLKTAYRRPRINIGYLALGHVIADLYDAQRINDSHIKTIYGSTVLTDKKFIGVLPIPSQLSPVMPSLSEESDHYGSDWYSQQYSLPAPNLEQDENEMVILGFTSTFLMPNHDRCQEIIRGGLFDPTEDEPNIHGEHFTQFWTADSYPSLLNNETSMLIENLFGRIEIGEGRWLALNPIYARELDWIYDENSCFAWYDQSGHKMVESVWWRQGSLITTETYSSGLRSEGWLVKASPKGLSQLLNLMFDTAWMYKVQKSTILNGDEQVNKWEQVFE